MPHVKLFIGITINAFTEYQQKDSYMLERRAVSVLLQRTGPLQLLSVELELILS